MSRLNSKISIASEEDVAPNNATEAGAEEWKPLYKDNLIYLPFARHLAEMDASGVEAPEEEQTERAA